MRASQKARIIVGAVLALSAIFSCTLLYLLKTWETP
jgi:hypothetical protein